MKCTYRALGRRSVDAVERDGRDLIVKLCYVGKQILYVFYIVTYVAGNGCFVELISDLRESDPFGIQLVEALYCVIKE